MAWSVIEDREELERALKCARGSYQRALLEGQENLSGSTLRGEARRWSSRYAESRHNLLDRMDREGVLWEERRGDHGRRILVIGKPPRPPEFPAHEVLGDVRAVRREVRA